MSRRIRDEVGDVASAEVRLCVGPDGRVQRVQVVRGTSSWAFDEALVHGMSDWQFLQDSGATTSLRRQNCEIAKISYQVY